MRYIGCKTLLLEDIKKIVDKHAANSGRICDIFSGTSTIARFFKKWFEVYSNDVLYFSYCLQMATIECPHKPEFKRLFATKGIDNPITYLNTISDDEMQVLDKDKRFFQNNYSPIGGRMYLNNANALRIDYTRNIVEERKRDNLLDIYEYY